MKKLLIGLTAAMMVTFSAFSVYALDIGARAYLWGSSINGDVAVDTSARSGTDVDFGDFDMDMEFLPVIEAFAGLGRHHFSVSIHTAEYKGDDTLNTPIIFNGRTFGINADVDTELKYTVCDFVYQRDLIDMENILAGGSLGLVVKVKYMDISTSLKSGGITEKEELSLPIPMIGANVHIGALAGLLEARAQATGIAYDGNSIIEVMGDVSFSPFPFVDIHGGYRAFIVSIDEDDVEAEFDTSGPYIAVKIGF